MGTPDPLKERQERKSTFPVMYNEIIRIRSPNEKENRPDGLNNLYDAILNMPLLQDTCRIHSLVKVT